MNSDCRDEILDEVIGILRRILRDPDIDLSSATELKQISSFDSPALFRLISEIEHASGVELDPEYIVPETFATPARIAQIFAQQLKTSGNAMMSSL
ncbi:MULTISPECIES: phosphopantetheine-binding protein [unclassified Bradyrhizobium]|uniref:acyl carrier protein n=1 Tax=unclassified Bradyrhizobium TaxID=2631580 RepID=UPI0028E79633|nr:MULTISPECIES: phosphopantetheine-binding protein [unclassified Bradyrhizobium]